MLLQRPDPLPQSKIVRPTNEKMYVIGHDDVSTDGNMVLRVRPDCELCEGAMDGLRCQDISAPTCTERNKIRRIVCEDSAEARRNLWIIGHANPAVLIVLTRLSRKAVAVALWATRAFSVSKRLQDRRRAWSSQRAP
jgi:hypothetical protein